MNAYHGVMNRDQILAAVRDCLDATGGIAAAYVFGSVARGEETTGSDVDVAVILTAGRPRSLAELPSGLEASLERTLGRDVDLVVLNGAPPDLVHRVLRDGVLVLEVDRSTRVEFEIQARNAYFDLKPILDQYRRAALKSA